MCNEEPKQLILYFIDNAKTAKPSEFHFIRNWKDYRKCVFQRRSFKLLVHALSRTSDRLYKKYLKGVSRGEGNFNQLLAYQQLQLTIKFYQGELDTYTDMVYEYDAYLMESCNFLDSALFGYVRPTEDLHDFRD